MINIFMKSPLPNTLAVIVLLALIITWVTSIVLSMRDVPVETEKGWYANLLPIFSILGIPAVLDLLQTKGVTFVFAAIVFTVLLLNIVVPILKIYGKSSHFLVADWYKWSVLISTVGGLAVAGYLTFVEATNAPVVCGPSDGCAAVQNSKYAVLFGVLPVGVLGLAGYVGILAGWLVLHFGPDAIKRMAALAVWAMCIFGVLFEIYLTFLEPFVIGSTCMWCISSAVLMIILLLVSTPAAQQAFVINDD
ncbi:MAG TPA: vitamin K epoxide reductase family protein [Anaerolineales bacterium]|nr:vitamin K epoxide reductase family protein [Anaerolineales bacterium]HMX17705.1 vitamin K epoxide reductase family protein [Anaerolineales bacterium]HMX73258.1 vitamin K epoxide reductase family protein [Anaerolineales bacterium]HNA54077.1 vitamin K epoxide reductase family protein [Anaerolineales bacterium]HNB86559.1 vitamin K epoxide reductase family protein [Anaerolineales bacterium]